MTATREPRIFRAGDRMPENRPDVFDTRGVRWSWDCDEEAYAAHGRDEVASWEKLLRLFGPLRGVL